MLKTNVLSAIVATRIVSESWMEHATKLPAGSTSRGGFVYLAVELKNFKHPTSSRWAAKKLETKMLGGWFCRGLCLRTQQGITRKGLDFEILQFIEMR